MISQTLLDIRTEIINVGYVVKPQGLADITEKLAMLEYIIEKFKPKSIITKMIKRNRKLEAIIAEYRNILMD